ncbi:MAG: hypothetical protein FJ154_01005 [Gammaproteobacteria bacterium]|nr:hypothetical protein [Gammaproteobacteria bacterium]
MTLLSRPPLPKSLSVDIWTAPFWEAAQRYELVVCRCVVCGRRRMPPSPFCPNCQSQTILWDVLPGTGRVYSYTIVYQPAIAANAAPVPYAPAVIALDGAPGIRCISAIVDCDETRLVIDMPVRVVWQALADGHLTAFFTPI